MTLRGLLMVLLIALVTYLIPLALGITELR